MTTKPPFRNPSRPPTHPGEMLREDVIPATGLTVQAIAESLGVSRQSLHNVLAEKAAVSPELAVRLGKYFGNGPQIWMRMQAAVDLWKAQQKLADEISHISPLKAA
jgi:addiction module HigA family antidote